VGAGPVGLFLEDERLRSVRSAGKEIIEPLRDVMDLRSSRRAGMTLVRPDGYIAWFGAGTSRLEEVRFLLRGHTAPVAAVAHQSC